LVAHVFLLFVNTAPVRTGMILHV